MVSRKGTTFSFFLMRRRPIVISVSAAWASSGEQSSESLRGQHLGRIPRRIEEAWWRIIYHACLRRSLLPPPEICNRQRPPAASRLSPFARGTIILPCKGGEPPEAAGGRWRLQISGGGNEFLADFRYHVF